MVSEYKLAKDAYHYKRQEIVTLVNDSGTLRTNEKRMKTTEVDRYREAGVVPAKLYAAKPRQNKAGYFYAREAVEWIILGRIIIRRSRVEVPTIGRIFKLVVATKGANPTTLSMLQDLYLQDENYAKFLRRLLTLGISLPAEIAEHAIPEGEA